MVLCNDWKSAMERRRRVRSIPAHAAAIMLAAIMITGCGSTHTSATDYDRHHGSFKGSTYDIRIRWDGDRCVERQIRITRDCGTCRTRNVTNAVVEDYDCDGTTDHMQFRRLDEEQRINKLIFDQDAWLAFHHFVPPKKRGLYRH